MPSVEVTAYQQFGRVAYLGTISGLEEREKQRLTVMRISGQYLYNTSKDDNILKFSGLNIQRPFEDLEKLGYIIASSRKQDSRTTVWRMRKLPGW